MFIFRYIDLQNAETQTGILVDMLYEMPSKKDPIIKDVQARPIINGIVGEIEEMSPAMKVAFGLQFIKKIYNEQE